MSDQPYEKRITDEHACLIMRFNHRKHLQFALAQDLMHERETVVQLSEELQTVRAQCDMLITRLTEYVG